MGQLRERFVPPGGHLGPKQLEACPGGPQTLAFLTAVQNREFSILS